MSSWIFIAIVGHLSNAVAFIVDKTLLTTALKRSSTYAALIGAFSLVTIVAGPWVKTWPTWSLYPAILGFGGCFVLALWAFFEAMKHAEASRVVPIVGSLIPLFTLAGTAVIFGERLNLFQAVGFALLLVATWMLTRGGSRKTYLTGYIITMSVVAAVLFAAASVFGKYAFEHGDFLGVFILSRVAAGVAGIAIGLSVAPARHELLSIIKPKHVRTTSGSRTIVWTIFGQACGAIGFLLVHLAIAQGSAALVNSLQAVQYAAIVLVAWFGGKHLARLLKEERTPSIMLTKSLAIVLVAFGLYFLT